MKVSKIKAEDVAGYLKLDDDSDDFLLPVLESAKSFVKSYTGLNEEQIDSHDDFYIAVMILCQDMYDNRSLHVDKNNVNRTVEIILGMHRVNLL